MPSIHPFTNVCRVAIPATAHGCCIGPLHVTIIAAEPHGVGRILFDTADPEAFRIDGMLEIDRDTLDVCITFAMPQSGHVSIEEDT